MSELIKVARTDQLPPGAHKLCTIEDRRIAIVNLGGGQTADKAKASDLSERV